MTVSIQSSMFWNDCTFPVVELSGTSASSNTKVMSYAKSITETFEKSSTFHQRVLPAYTFLESFQVSLPGLHSTAV